MHEHNLHTHIGKSKKGRLNYVHNVPTFSYLRTITDRTFIGHLHFPTHKYPIFSYPLHTHTSSRKATFHICKSSHLL